MAFSLGFRLLLGNHIWQPGPAKNKNNFHKKHASFNVEHFFKGKMAKRLRPAKSRAQFVPDHNSSDSDDSEVVVMKVTSREVANVVPMVPAVVRKKRVTWRSELEDVQEIDENGNPINAQATLGGAGGGAGDGEPVVYDLTTAEAFDALREPLPQGYIYKDVVEARMRNNDFRSAIRRIQQHDREISDGDQLVIWTDDSSVQSWFSVASTSNEHSGCGRGERCPDQDNRLEDYPYEDEDLSEEASEAGQGQDGDENPINVRNF
jgi:hypothetical protein